MTQRSIRRYKCKRCNKNTTDYLANARGVFDDGVKWEQENIDLCDKCFKITRKEVSQTEQISEMIALKIVKDEDLTKFQEDKKFKQEKFREYQNIKRLQLKKRNDKNKGIGVSPSNARRKESRGVLQGVRGIEGKNGR